MGCRGPKTHRACTSRPPARSKGKRNFLAVALNGTAGPTVPSCSPRPVISPVRFCPQQCRAGAIRSPRIAAVTAGNVQVYFQFWNPLQGLTEAIQTNLSSSWRGCIDRLGFQIRDLTISGSGIGLCATGVAAHKLTFQFWKIESAQIGLTKGAGSPEGGWPFSLV